VFLPILGGYKVKEDAYLSKRAVLGGKKGKKVHNRPILESHTSKAQIDAE